MPNHLLLQICALQHLNTALASSSFTRHWRNACYYLCRFATEGDNVKSPSQRSVCFALAAPSVANQPERLDWFTGLCRRKGISLFPEATPAVRPA